MYRYHVCGSVHRQRAASDCPVGRISAPALEQTVVSFLCEVGKHPATTQAAVEASHTIKKVERPPLLAEIKSLQSSLDAVAKKLRHCIQAIEAGGAARTRGSPWQAWFHG